MYLFPRQIKSFSKGDIIPKNAVFLYAMEVEVNAGIPRSNATCKKAVFYYDVELTAEEVNKLNAAK